MKNHAKDIINAADKYSVVSLKLEVEAEVAHARSTKITMGTPLTIFSKLIHETAHFSRTKSWISLQIAENSLSASQKLSFTGVPLAIS